MADQMLVDFLSGPALTRMANSEKIRRGLPNKLPAQLLTPSPVKPMGQEVQWWEVQGNRQLAQLVQATSPSRKQNMGGATKKYATAVGSKEHITLDQEFLLKLKSDIAQVREGAQAVLLQSVGNFRNRFESLRVAVVASAFALGHIYADGNGSILPSSTGAVLDVNFNLNATLTKASALIGDWSAAATNIQLSLQAIRTAGIQATNYEPRTIMYGKSIPGWIMANTMLKDYLSRNQRFNDGLVTTGQIPNGFLDYDWVPVGDSYFVDADGVIRTWFPDNSITVLPAIEDNWYEFFEAGTLVPNEYAAIGATLDEMITKCSVRNGLFGYAEMMSDPIAAKLIIGDYHLPVIKVPGAITKATVS